MGNQGYKRMQIYCLGKVFACETFKLQINGFERSRQIYVGSLETVVSFHILVGPPMNHILQMLHEENSICKPIKYDLANDVLTDLEGNETRHDLHKKR